MEDVAKELKTDLVRKHNAETQRLNELNLILQSEVDQAQIEAKELKQG
jgi:hypothetical protein